MEGRGEVDDILTPRLQVTGGPGGRKGDEEGET